MMAIETPTEWKPGDVAMVTGRWFWNKPHTTERAIRDKERWTTGGRDVMDHEVSDARHLVVIDPEDAEQVERLADIFCAVPSSGWVEQMQAALREFARPTPRIEEPPGLGAVVEDAKGNRWYRTADASMGVADDTPLAVWKRDYTSRCQSVSFTEIAATRVLSHGVTEGAS